MGLEENLAQKPISAWDPTGGGFGVDLTISERISLWQNFGTHFTLAEIDGDQYRW